MPRPHNLISDSPLVQETFDFVMESGGQASFTEISESIFHLTNATPELAASLVGDLVQNDPRFLPSEQYLTVKADGLETESLDAVDFVVMDIEAIAGKSRPTRIIEIGGCGFSRGRIVDEFESLVNPKLPIPPFISALTGITEEMLASAPPF